MQLGAQSFQQFSIALDKIDIFFGSFDQSYGLRIDPFHFPCRLPPETFIRQRRSLDAGSGIMRYLRRLLSLWEQIRYGLLTMEFYAIDMPHAASHKLESFDISP
jgi:hypothetical protein